MALFEALASAAERPRQVDRNVTQFIPDLQGCIPYHLEHKVVPSACQLGNVLADLCSFNLQPSPQQTDMKPCARAVLLSAVIGLASLVGANEAAADLTNMAGLMDMLSTADKAYMAQMPAEDVDEGNQQYAVALAEKSPSGGWKAYGCNFRQKSGGSGGGSNSKTCSTPFKKCGGNCVDIRDEMDFCGTCNTQVRLMVIELVSHKPV